MTRSSGQFETLAIKFEISRLVNAALFS